VVGSWSGHGCASGSDNGVVVGGKQEAEGGGIKTSQTEYTPL